MAFPRRFKREIWYLRLPSGEIEIVTPTALQRAFECGLVDVRTPVRAFGAHTWTTMAEAAQLDVPGSPSIASLAPMAFDAPAADLGAGALWQSRKDVDPRAFKPSRAPALAALLISVSFVGVALLGADADASNSLSGTAESTSLTCTTRARPPMHDLLRAVKPEAERLTEDQKRRLRELDAITRTQRPRASSRTPLLGAHRVPSSGVLTSIDPFASGLKTGASRGDPLDGSL